MSGPERASELLPKIKLLFHTYHIIYIHLFITHTNNRHIIGILYI